MIIEVKVPAAGESVTEATVGAILVESGSFVEIDEPFIELETDKANLALNAEQAGRLELLVEEEEDVVVGQVIAKIDTDAVNDKPKAMDNKKENVAEEPTKPETSKSEATTEAAPKAAVKSAHSHAQAENASPSANKLMAENNIHPGQVVATGPGARILREDVVNAIKNPAPATDGYGAFPPPPIPEYMPPMPEPIVQEKETRKKMTRLRRVIAKKLVEAKNTTAMLTTFNEVDLWKVMDYRARYKERFKETHDVGLGFMSFFMKAAIEALKSYPEVNAYIEGNDVVYRNYYDISIAVGTPKGLVVPVVRDCEQKSFSEIEKSIMELAIKGRDGKLSIEDMEGGGFTISNGGVYGSLISTPILNPPQSAILGMHKIEKRAVVVNDEIVIRPMMYLALSYDHRIIDGKEGVGFLVKIKEMLEDPASLLFDL